MSILDKPRVLDYDPVRKVRSMFHPSTDGNTFTVAGKQEIGDRLDINKHLQDEHRVKGFGEGRRMASIPIVVWEDLIRRGIAGDMKKLKKWLNDPDQLAFRTMRGRI